MKPAVKSGAIIPVLLMLPNLAWMLFYSLDAGARSGVPFLMNSWWMFTAALSFGVFHVWALSLTRL